jgi:hypothetical protein
LKQEILDIINSAIDEITSEYEDNHHIIFDSESERRGIHYSGVNRRLKSWNRRKQCIYRGCTEKSIRRSHSIQKSGPLKEISKNSHVLTPAFNQNNGVIELVEIGLSQASVFPGFCDEHEKLFSSFENNKDTTSAEALTLQIYRTICREIVRLRHEIYNAELMISEYKEFRNKKLKILVENKLGTNWMKQNDVKIHSFELSEDPILNAAIEHVSGLKQVIDELENEHLKEIEDELDGLGTKALKPISISIDEKIPLSLSGMGSFYVGNNKSQKKIIVALIVLPSRNGTTIVIHGKSEDTNYYHGYMARLKKSFDLLNMVEQWMIRGTDHWFIDSDVWEPKSKDEKESILEEILDGSKGLAHELSFSIFDDLRRRIIKEWESEDLLDGEGLKTIDIEKDKLR